jgi:hypothetical protein
MALSVQTRRTVVAITGTASLLVAGATLADAAVSTGVITVCVEKGNQELHLKTQKPCPRGWTQLSFNARGAPGARGAVGRTGLTGLTGAAGATGPAGVAGVAGIPGVQGPPGPQGASGGGGGVQGPPGATGATGAAGAPGPAGITDGDIARQSGTVLIPGNSHSEVVSYDAAIGKHLLAHAKLTVSSTSGSEGASLVTCTLGVSVTVPAATRPNDSATVSWPLGNVITAATVALTNSYNTMTATAPTHIAVSCASRNGESANVTNAVLDVIELTDLDDEEPAPALSPVSDLQS